MSKQTAVEWLDRWFRDNPEATHQEGNKALHQAKEMEKQQIIDAYHINPQEAKWKNIGINYYNETYGANHIVDTNEMIDHIGDANKMVEAEEKPMRYHCVPKEISDEEIIKLANEHILYNDSKRQWVIEGMKLYKEQLKGGNNE